MAPMAELVKAAIVIQTGVRGMLARKERAWRKQQKEAALDQATWLHWKPTDEFLPSAQRLYYEHAIMKRKLERYGLW